MTVSLTTNRVNTAGNGVTTLFPFNYPYRAATDLRVILKDNTTLVETLQVLNTDYTLAGVANANTGGFDSGGVTFATAPAVGKTVIINRGVPLTSSYDPTAGGVDTAPAREGAIDRLTLQLQTLREMIARAPLLPEGNTLSDLSLPNVRADLANNLLAINATGDGFTAVETSTLDAGQTVTAFVQTVLDDTNAAAVLTTLGVTPYAQTLLDDANAGAALTTLGVSAFVQTLLNDAAAVNFLATLGFLSGSATIDFASVADNASSAAANVTVTGAAVGDFVLSVTASGNIMTTDLVWLLGKVTAADTVEVSLHNDSAGAFDAASQTVYVLVAPKALFGL